MKLKPPETPFSQSSPIPIQDNLVPEEISTVVIDEILEASGLINKPKDDSPTAEFKKYLTDKGGSLKDVAEQVVNIMSRGESEATRLNAAKFIAQIQGIALELEEGTSQVTKEININIMGSQNQNFLNLVMPKG